jgi:putative membrane protein
VGVKGPTASTESRIARVALLGHALLLVLSGVAFATFLAPPSPAWLATPANQVVVALMFSFGGQTTVVLGAIAGISHAASRLGWKSALSIFAAGFSISLAAELTGTATGFPFGPYSYTARLGYLIRDRVPINIPTSWFFMLYASLAICGRLLSARDDSLTKWRWAAAAALVLTAWDVAMDPAMVVTTHWLWHLPAGDGSLVRRVFLSGLFYGMPLANWLGWLLTGCFVARAMLVIVPPSRWAATVSTARLPLVLYAVNGIFPILVCAGRGMWWAAVFGAAAMLLPLSLALRAGMRKPMTLGSAGARGRVALAGD